MIEFFKRLFRRRRYFYISYKTESGFGCTTTINTYGQFVNQEWFINQYKDGSKTVIINSIFEFKNKRDYDSFIVKDIS